MCFLDSFMNFHHSRKKRGNSKLILTENQPAMDYIEKQTEFIREALRENIKNCIATLNLSKTEAGKIIS